jgi:hypothetical protein
MAGEAKLLLQGGQTGVRKDVWHNTV